MALRKSASLGMYPLVKYSDLGTFFISFSLIGGKVGRYEFDVFVEFERTAK